MKSSNTSRCWVKAGTLTKVFVMILSGEGTADGCRGQPAQYWLTSNSAELTNTGRRSRRRRGNGGLHGREIIRTVSGRIAYRHSWITCGIWNINRCSRAYANTCKFISTSLGLDIGLWAWAFLTGILNALSCSIMTFHLLAWYFLVSY